MTARDNPSRGALAFYGLLIFCGLCIVGRLDYADAVIRENERLQAEVTVSRIECARDSADAASPHAMRMEM